MRRGAAAVVDWGQCLRVLASSSLCGVFFSGRRMRHLSVASVSAASTARGELVGICSAAEAIRFAQAERRISADWRLSFNSEVFKEYRFLRFQTMLQGADL